MSLYKSVFFSKVSAITDLESRRTPWCSIWICNTLQLLNGIQFSLFYTSMWPYLKTLDPNANIDFFGWVIAVFSAGQTVASFLFGIWNQKVKSTKYPASCGMVLMVAGNLMYAILPILQSGQKWIMLAARLVVGFGTGNLSVLRSYVAVGCAQKDRVKAVSLGIGMFVLGLSIGPAIMVVFTPLGPNGFLIGSFPVTMYNLPAIVMHFHSTQDCYPLILDVSSEVVLPKFDKIPAAICIAVWFALQCVATNSEVLMTPLTMALYNWTNQEAIFWNGIIIAACNVISFTLYLLIALTNIGKFDKRKMILAGLTGFSIYHLVNIPWPFYSGPLDYIKTDVNSTVEDMANLGGCSHSYEWCNHTTRIPFPVFVVSSTIFLGISYPCVGSPSGTLFAEIIGPRSQIETGRFKTILQLMGVPRELQTIQIRRLDNFRDLCKEFSHLSAASVDSADRLLPRSCQKCLFCALLEVADADTFSRAKLCLDYLCTDFMTVQSVVDAKAVVVFLDNKAPLFLFTKEQYQSAPFQSFSNTLRYRMNCLRRSGKPRYGESCEDWRHSTFLHDTAFLRKRLEIDKAEHRQPRTMATRYFNIHSDEFFSALFEQSGYLWPMLLLLIILIVCISAVLICRKRLVPLQLIPPLGVATPYKRGVFYRL
uniref:MFS domain-containing protein n=1 Tax=Ascaris lumbricoides TaxID=6252 RepID=A0A0M3IBC0_ASCLU